MTRGDITYDFGPWGRMSPQGMDFVRCCLQRAEADRMSVEDALSHPWLAAHGL